MARDLNKLFRNPPKGGNGVGVATQNPMTPNPRAPSASPTFMYGNMGGGGTGIGERREAAALDAMSPEERSKYYQSKFNDPPWPSSGPQAQSTLRETFEKGEAAARGNVLQSGRVDQPEFRNYDRGRIPTQTQDDPSAVGTFDYESAQAGFTGRVDDGQQAGNPAPQPDPKPVLDPDVSVSYRGDGKQHRPMPRTGR